MSSSEYSFTTKTRLLLNKFIAPAGLEINTKTRENSETERLFNLKNKNHWQQEKYIQGLNLNIEKYIQFLKENCVAYKHDINILPGFSNNNKLNDYYLNNDFFGTVDAEILYCIIRKNKPNHIIEVGSGFSTRLMRKAIRDENAETKIICIDPQPRIEILEHADEHLSFFVENIEQRMILNKLGPDDVLFIDSSHIVATGNDVNYLFLEILPQLPAGVFVHIHDIFFPFDYPEEWVIKERWGWNEQYLVQAFLMFNETFEIIWPSHYMYTTAREELYNYFQPPVNNYRPSSLWIRKIK